MANGKLDPGEEADLILVLQNVGSGVGPTEATLVSHEPSLVVIDGSGAFGPAGAGETTASISDRFRVRAQPDAPIELPAWCDLIVTGSGYHDTIPIPVIVGDSMNLPAGPDGYGYRIYDWTDSCYSARPEYDWFEIRGIGTPVFLGDDAVTSIGLPTGFGPWRYYGQSYERLSICSNGWIAADTTSRCDFTNVELPYAGAPPNIVAFMWDDLYPPGYGNIWFFHDSAHHRFIIEFDSVPYFSPREAWEKVQVQLYDTTVVTPTGDNSILIQFQTANHYQSATVGLQNRDGSSGLTHVWNDVYPRVSAPLTARRALRFETVANVGVADSSDFGAGSGPRLEVAPNPFRSRTNIRFGPASDRAKFRVAVYSADGRLVRQLVPEAGSGCFVWDGCDELGQPAGAGLFFVRAEAGTRRLVQKLVRLP
ncbi:MAG: hypothetical protein ABIK44_01190 [candidate division WOR-3 bacterium]